MPLAAEPPTSTAAEPAGGAIAAPAHPVFGLSDRLVDDYATLRPFHATFMGVDGQDHEWGDLGPASIEALADLLRTTRKELAALPAPDDRWSELAWRVLDEELAEQLDAIEHGDPLRDLAHSSSTVPMMRDALAAQDVTTLEGREAVVSRLEQVPAALAGLRDTLDLGRQRDILAARRQALSVADQLRTMTADDGAFRQRAAQLVTADPALRDRLDAALADARVAALTLADWLERDYLPDASEVDAVGDERYARMARRYLGTDLDPHEATSWGWELIRALWGRAEQAARAIDGDVSLPQVMHRLKTDPAFAAASQTEFVTLMQERQEHALRALDGTHFHVPDGIRAVEVRLATAAPPGAWYIGPSEDLARPGTVWWSLGDTEPVPLYEEVSTAYHEGFPGHHLQIGVQTTLTDRLSRAHRMLCWRPGYGEGWALYAEQLMDELGSLERPEYEIGYLTGSLLRAVRVVADLGLHLGLRVPDDAMFHPGADWSYDLAVEALEEIAFLSPTYARSEVTRYLGLPAQAISYAVGQRAIVELRAERRAREGAAFDLRTFHADVIGSGPVGLDHLRELVLPEH